MVHGTKTEKTEVSTVTYMINYIKRVPAETDKDSERKVSKTQSKRRRE